MLPNSLFKMKKLSRVRSQAFAYVTEALKHNLNLQVYALSLQLRYSAKHFTATNLGTPCILIAT